MAISFTNAFSFQLLVVGALLALGKRTITSVLRGKARRKHFTTINRVLSQAQWSALAASQLMLRQLLAVFTGQGALAVGIDETLERRWGSKIKARDIYGTGHPARYGS